jgi:hypothetical protein
MIKVSTLWNGLARSVKNFPVPWKKSIKAEKNEMSVSMLQAGACGLSDQSTACKGLDTQALRASERRFCPSPVRENRWLAKQRT